MDAFYYECRKMFIHHKGILIIVLFIFLSIICRNFFDKPYNAELESGRASYNYYLDRLGGKCTAKTDKFIANESSRIAKAQSGLQTIYDDYYSGKLSDKQFHARVVKLKAAVKYETGFELIYDQYMVIRQQKSNRYFLYTNGWDGLLSNDSPDWLLVLLLLMLVTPVFCYEYESKMDKLILTEIKGGKTHAGKKIILALLVTAVLCLLSQIFRYAFYQIKYGLPHGGFPLQSLEYFNSSAKQVTLLGAFFEVTAGKLFGYLCFTTIIMFVSVCVRKYAPTLLISTAVLLLPYCGFSIESSKYFLPGPIGFMISTGFLRGSTYKTDSAANEKLITFQALSGSTIALLFAVTMVLIMVMLCVTLAKHTNVNLKMRRGGMKIVSISTLLCIMISLLGGCSAPVSDKAQPVYNMELDNTYETPEYLFCVKYFDTSGNITFKNRKTGKTDNLIRDPMRSLATFSDSIFGDGDYVYYLRFDYEDSSFRGKTPEEFSVIQVDTHDFSERTIYEKRFETDKNSFFSLSGGSGVNDNFYNEIKGFFLNERYIFFVTSDSNKGDKIRKIDRLTGQTSIIITSSTFLKTVAFDGTNIYYVDETESAVKKYNTETGKGNEISSVVTTSFYLIGKDILYINRRDNDRIYEMSIANSKIKKLTDSSALIFTLKDGYVVYTDKNDLKEYKIRVLSTF